MGKKIWKSMHPRNFGPSTRSCKPGWNFPFQVPARSAVHHIATRTFRKKKNSKNKADSFFRLNFNVFIGVDNKERARARD